MKLELLDTSFGYRERTVVSHLSATFHESRMVGILGNNGIGKSTLLKGILGLNPVRSGRVLLDGESIPEMSPQVRACRLAYLEQQASCHWPMTVERVISLGRHPHGPGRRDAEIILQAMQMTDTHGLAQRPVTQLSGGERTRVMLARSLAVGAPVLIADEPIAGLDPHHQVSVMTKLKRWAAGGRMVILTLHDLNLALHYCDDVLMLGHGMYYFGEADSLLDVNRLSRFFHIRAEVAEVGGLQSLVNWKPGSPSAHP